MGVAAPPLRRSPKFCSINRMGGIWPINRMGGWLQSCPMAQHSVAQQYYFDLQQYCLVYPRLCPIYIKPKTAIGRALRIIFVLMHFYVDAAIGRANAAYRF
jgi:hypothetical protein